MPCILNFTTTADQEAVLPYNRRIADIAQTINWSLRSTKYLGYGDTLTSYLSPGFRFGLDNYWKDILDKAEVNVRLHNTTASFITTLTAVTGITFDSSTTTTGKELTDFNVTKNDTALVLGTDYTIAWFGGTAPVGTGSVRTKARVTVTLTNPLVATDTLKIDTFLTIIGYGNETATDAEKYAYLRDWRANYMISDAIDAAPVPTDYPGAPPAP